MSSRPSDSERDSDQRDSEHDDDDDGNNHPAIKGWGRQLSENSKKVIDKTWSLIWSDVSAKVNDAHHVMQAVVKPLLPVSGLKIRMHHSTSGNDSAAGGLPATYGKVTFTQDLEQQNQKPALFACMSSDTELELVKRLLLENWGLKEPSVIISVTGSAEGLSLDSELEEKVTQGIARAASATHAWTFTGGTDAGVMKLVAGALASENVVTPIIGVAAFHKISDKERFFNAERDRDRGTSGQERKVPYIKRMQNSDASSALDEKHTHFLLVDGGIGSSWGSEIEFRGKVEEKICEDLRVPRVLLVIQGGPGTFRTVTDTLLADCHVVIVKESGGCAQAVAEFVEPLLQQKSELFHDLELLKEKVEERLHDADFLERLKARLRPSARPPVRQRALHSALGTHCGPTRLPWLTLPPGADDSDAARCDCTDAAPYRKQAAEPTSPAAHIHHHRRAPHALRHGRAQSDRLEL